MPKENIVSIRLRGACVMKQRNIFYESLVVMSFKFLIVLGAGPWQVSLIRLILFYSRDVNRAARKCVINEWFCRTVFFFLPLYLSSYD